MQIAAGTLTDRFGQRFALTLLMALSSLACFALALVESLPALLAVSVMARRCSRASKPCGRCFLENRDFAANKA